MKYWIKVYKGWEVFTLHFEKRNEFLEWIDIVDGRCAERIYDDFEVCDF